MNKMQSRTFWMVLFMILMSSYLAYSKEWEPTGLAIVWTVLLSAWIGGKAWASGMDVVGKFLGGGK